MKKVIMSMLAVALFVGTGCKKDEETPVPTPIVKGIMTTPSGVKNVKGAAMIYYGEFEGTHFSSVIFYAEGISINLDSMRFEGKGDVQMYDLYSDQGPGLNTGTHSFSYNFDGDAGYDECIYFVNADLNDEEVEASYAADENSTGSVIVTKTSNTNYNFAFSTQNVINANDLANRVSINTTFNSTLDYIDDSNLQAPTSLEDLRSRNPFRKFSVKSSK